MKYSVLRSDIAESQLTDILHYITMISGGIQSALDLLDEIEEAGKQLEDFPESGVRPRDIVIRRRGFRFLIVKNYYLFYKIDHQSRTVVIHAIIYMRADYKQLL